MEAQSDKPRRRSVQDGFPHDYFQRGLEEAEGIEVLESAIGKAQIPGIEITDYAVAFDPQSDKMCLRLQAKTNEGVKGYYDSMFVPSLCDDVDESFLQYMIEDNTKQTFKDVQPN